MCLNCWYQGFDQLNFLDTRSFFFDHQYLVVLLILTRAFSVRISLPTLSIPQPPHTPTTTLSQRQNCFLEGEKKLIIFMNNTDIHTVHKWVYNIPVLLTFHGKGAISEKCLYSVFREKRCKRGWGALLQLISTLIF